MRKINIEIPEPKKIEINGKVYTVNQSDSDIMIHAAAMVEEFTNLSKTDKHSIEDFSKISDAIKRSISYTDKILGDGAVKEITGGRAVGLKTMLDIMNQVCGAVIDEYSDNLTEEYADITPPAEKSKRK